MRYLLPLLSCVLIFPPLAWAQNAGKPASLPAPAKPNAKAPQPAADKTPVPDAALRQAIAAHAKAVGSGDFKGAAAFWTADGDYADQTGKLFAVRKLLEEEQSDKAAAGGRSKVTLKTASIRMVSPDVAIENGTTEQPAAQRVVGPSGAYTAVWVRQGGKWLLSSLREHAANAAAAPRSPLADLEWLVGHWKAEHDGATYEAKCDWAPNKQFLLSELTIWQDDAMKHVISQRIGWDPASSRIKSWSFAADGGHAEGYWEREGNAWVSITTNTNGDGTTTGSRNSYTNISDKGFDFEAIETGRPTAPPPQKLHFVGEKGTETASAEGKPRDEKEQAAREKILNSPAWRQTQQAYHEWISAQPYTPEEISKMKTEFADKIASASADQLQDLLAGAQEKMAVLNSPAAIEARQWLGARMALMFKHTPEEIATMRPDLVKMTAGQLQEQVQKLQARQAKIEQDRQAFDRLNQQKLQAIDRMESSQARAAEAARNRPAASYPYGNMLGTPVRQYNYTPPSLNYGIWVW